MTYLLYSWKLTTLNPLHLSLLPPPSLLATMSFFSVTMSLFLFCLFFFILNFTWEKSLRNLSFSVRLISLQHNNLQVHPCCNKWESSLFFLQLSNIPVCVCVCVCALVCVCMCVCVYLLYPFTDWWYLGWFHVSVIINNAAVNIWVHISLVVSVFVFFS